MNSTLRSTISVLLFSLIASLGFGCQSSLAPVNDALAKIDALPPTTALDAYVSKPDPTYEWKLLASVPKEAGTIHVLELTSQKWRSKEEVNRTLWKHWLYVVVPKKLVSNKAMLFISGGSNRDKKPGSPSGQTLGIAVASQAVVAELKMIPNQPLAFADDNRDRYEDDLIAHTWNKAMETGDPTWVARMPMVKGAVKAMDAIQEFLKSEAGGKVTVDEFVVAGGSKRGWTTWLTGAVDQRVVAIIPIVIDVLNMIPSMEHHYAAYGFWAPAVGDYERNGIMAKKDDPKYQALARLVDPYYYRHRLKMPKFIVNASGDQFFLPDSSQFYFDDLQGEKVLRYVANADHSLKNSDAGESIQAYFQSIVTDTPRPNFSWHFTKDGGIKVTLKTKPEKVTLWQATNPDARDFRLDVVGPIWKSSPLQSQGQNNTYIAKVTQPEKGWTAFFIEMEFKSGGPNPFKFTSGVKVTPNVLPHLDKLKALNKKAGK